MAEVVSSREYEAPALLAEDGVIFPHTEVVITARDEKNITALLQATKERQLIVFMPSRDLKGVSESARVQLVQPVESGRPRPEGMTA